MKIGAEKNMTTLRPGVEVGHRQARNQESEAHHHCRIHMLSTMMRPLSVFAVTSFLVSIEHSSAFVLVRQPVRTTPTNTSPRLFGYLDDLAKDLSAQNPNPDVDADSKEMTDMARDKLDRYGPGDFSQFKVRLDVSDGSANSLTFSLRLLCP
jgi:hypothetical protein